MKCPNCSSTDGAYREIEDFNPGGDPEWSYYEFWQCFSCDHTVYSYEDGFEYSEDE